MRTLSCIWMIALSCMAGEGWAGSEEGLGEDRSASALNPLIEEMRILDVAFREAVSGVSVGDGQRVLRALDALHGAKEKTHEGIHAGHVHLPKNADRLEEFVRLDEEFHGRLEDLTQAARLGSQVQMLEVTKDLLDRCVGCHQSFRE